MEDIDYVIRIERDEASPVIAEVLANLKKIEALHSENSRLLRSVLAGKSLEAVPCGNESRPLDGDRSPA